MSNESVTEFCKWWASLSPQQLPRPAATVFEEHKHQRYYLFAEDLKRRWSASRDSIDQILSSEQEKVRAAIASASQELVRWFDDVARPALDEMLSGLRKSGDALLVRLAGEGGPFAVRSRAWLAELRKTAAEAVEILDQVPPYLSLGAQAHRPELPLRRSTGVWATVEVLHNWPWRDLFTIRDSLADLKESSLQECIDQTGAVATLLTGHCEAAWLKALKTIPVSCASVHFDVATSSWVAAHVLSLVLDARDDGIMTRQAHDWAQQLLAPFQVWYAKHGGSEELRADRNGIEVIEPIRALNTAFVPPNPEVTWLPSSHVRNYCLFLRFLGDQVVAGAAEHAVISSLPSASLAGVTKAKEKRAQSLRSPVLAPMKAPSVDQCVIDAVWTERGYTLRLGTVNALDQRPVHVLPAFVVRVLGVVGQIKSDDGQVKALKKDDPSRFRAWFRAHFDVADGGDPLPLTKGSFIRAWRSSPPKQS